MKKLSILIVISLAFIFSFTSCNKNNPKSKLYERAGIYKNDVGTITVTVEMDGNITFPVNQKNI